MVDGSLGFNLRTCLNGNLQYGFNKNMWSNLNNHQLHSFIFDGIHVCVCLYVIHVEYQNLIWSVFCLWYCDLIIIRDILIFVDFVDSSNPRN